MNLDTYSDIPVRTWSDGVGTIFFLILYWTCGLLYGRYWCYCGSCDLDCQLYCNFLVGTVSFSSSCVFCFSCYLRNYEEDWLFCSVLLLSSPPGFDTLLCFLSFVFCLLTVLPIFLDYVVSVLVLHIFSVSRKQPDAYTARLACS